MLLTAVIAASLIYLVWRIFFTIPVRYGLLATLFGLALLITEAVAILEAVSHYYNMRRAKVPEKPDIPDAMFPDVDVLIATHSEDVALLYKTVNACRYLQYPDKSKVHIYLCDDTNRHAVRELAMQMEIGYFGLAHNKDAKAGNLNNALAQTQSPLVVTFDADMCPISEFLLETVPYFLLPQMVKEDGVWRRREASEIVKTYKIGFVQAPQSFYNADLFQYNLYAEKHVPNEQDYFFREVNVGRNHTNSVIYAGSNTVISRAALEEVGGIRTGTITEDFATGMDIQAKGYTSIALSKELAHGLSPSDFKSLIKQRQRWARGCVQVLRNPRFLFSSLSPAAKFSYSVCFLYWWTFLRRLIYILSPVLFVVFGIVMVDCTLPELFLIWLPYHLLYNLTLQAISGNIRTMRWSNIIDTILFPYLIVPVVAEFFGFQLKKFSVTPKTASTARNSELYYAAPHLILALITAIAFCTSAHGILASRNYGGVVVLYWLLVNLYTLLNAVVFLSGRINYRRDDRLQAQVPISLRLGSSELQGVTADLSEHGMAVLLDTTVVLPNHDCFPVELRERNYRAVLLVHLKDVQQAGKQWRHSLQIVGSAEIDRRQYLQILLDRQHTLPKTIQAGFLQDCLSVARGLTSRVFASYRKLPRVWMQTDVPTVDGPGLL